MEKYGNDHFLISCCKSGIKIIETKNNRFVCEIPSKGEWTLLEEVNKSCFIKIINRRKIPETLTSIYDDGEIMFKVVIYR